MAAKGSAGKAGAIDLERYRNDPTATALDLAGQKLTSSQLSDVASLLDKSKALTDLNVEKCQLGDDKISSLAKVLENNTQLKKLNLQYNLLSRNALKNLEKSVHNNLSLIDLKIKEKPMDVNGLRLDGLPGATLKSIDDCIRENQLIAKIVAGEGNQLRILNRRLERIPVFLLNCLHLTQVQIAGSLITAIPPEIGKCLNIEKAVFAKNMITALPKELGHMARLQYLDVSYNQLSGLPETLALLEQLQYLDISNNKLKKLPTTLGTMDRLQKIRVAGNPLNRVPKEIIDSGNTQDLKTYLRESENSEKCYRMKLMFVGKENSGKTTLLKCLMKGSSGPKASFFKNLPQLSAQMRSSGDPEAAAHENLSTDGIEIREWTVKASAALPDQVAASSAASLRQNDVTFCTFDFAGQEVYYTSHQFFLSQRAIYLVVFNVTEGLKTLDKVDYWLQSVQVRAPQAPVVLVGTHIDDPRCTEDYIVRVFNEMRGQLSKEYNVRAQIAVSCKTNLGIDELRSRLLELAWAQPSMGERIPASYLSLEARVKGLVAAKTLVPPTMSWREFRALATECGLADRSVTAAAQFLHDLGSLVYFHEMDADLHDIVILDPQWITDLLASIITTKQNFVRDGMLKHSDLPFIWRFDAALHAKLLRLLERFEVSFQMPEEDRTLIPCLLPDARPEFDTLWSSGVCTQQFHREYELSFLPKGLFSRLIVRLLHFSRGVVMWQNGIVLQDETSKALIELAPKERTITIWIRGTATCETMLRLIIDTLEALLNSWFHVPFKRFMPCPHCKASPDQSLDAHRFTYEETALAFAASGAASALNCVQPGHQVNVGQIAPDLAFSEFKGTVVDSREIEIGDLVANTAYGAVHHGYWQKEEVAVKEVRLHAVASTDEKLRTFYAFRHEVWMMGSLSHPNIVQLRGFSLNPFFLILEWVPSGDLYQWLHKADLAARLTHSMRQRIALDIAQGMTFLHGQMPPILHRDLKSPNVFVASSDPNAPVLAKVADFGLASRLFISELKEKSKSRAVETPTWLAPEVLLEQPYTEKSDVYAFGIILWELLTGEHPFGEFQYKFGHQLEDAIKNGIRPIIPGTCPTPYRDLIAACWDAYPARRPLFHQVVHALNSMIAGAPVTPLLRASSLVAVAPAAATAAAGTQNTGSGRAGSPSPPSASPVAAAPAAFAAASRASSAPAINGASGSPAAERRAPPVSVFANGSLERTLAVKPVCMFTAVCGVSSDRVLVGTNDGNILIFSARSGEQLDVKAAVHQGAVRALSPSGNDVWTGGEDGVVNMFSLRLRSTVAESDLSGMLNKLHGKAFLARSVAAHFALSPVQDELLYFKRKGDLEPKRRVQLAGATVEPGERKDGQYTFRVAPRAGKALLLATDREEERTRWVSGLRGAVERTRDVLSTPAATRKLGKPIVALAVSGGEVWAACRGQREVFLITKAGVQAVHLTSANVLPSADAASLYPSFAAPVGAPLAQPSTSPPPVRESGTISSVYATHESVWVGAEKHLYRVERATLSAMCVASPHLFAITSICATDAAIWSASSDRLCTWAAHSEANAAPVKSIELTVASVVCLLPLGQFVWLGGHDGRTKKPVVKVWLASDTTCVKDIDTPHGAQLSGLAIANSRSVWSVARDSTICSWV